MNNENVYNVLTSSLCSLVYPEHSIVRVRVNTLNALMISICSLKMVKETVTEVLGLAEPGGYQGWSFLLLFC